jgi:hypothetical protein
MEKAFILTYAYIELQENLTHVQNLILVCKMKKAYKGSTPFNTYCIVSHHIKLVSQECAYLPSYVELNLLSRKPSEDFHAMNLSL